MRARSSLTYAVAATASLAFLPGVAAWGAAGHEIVATIAQIYMHPTALANACDILFPGSADSGASPPCYLSKVATWADQVRRQPQYRRTAAMHYIGALGDHPGDLCAFPGPRGWAGRRDANVLGQVRNMTEILVAYTDGDFDRDVAEEALKFLVHFVGDMHMPLHLTGRDRGGNGAKVTFDGRVTNLHSLWDGLLISQALRSMPRNYTRPLPPGSTSIDVETHLQRDTIYDPYVRRVMFEGMGVSNIPGRFENEYLGWTLCPEKEAETAWTSVQKTLGLRQVADEERWDDEVLCPYAWGKDLHKLNCELPVWPAELDMPPYNNSRLLSTDDAHDHGDDMGFFSRPPQPHPDLLELDTPEYAGKIRRDWVVERLVATAGIRLAGLLNGLFMNPEGLVDGCTELPLVLVRM